MVYWCMLHGITCASNCWVDGGEIYTYKLTLTFFHVYLTWFYLFIQSDGGICDSFGWIKGQEVYIYTFIKKEKLYTWDRVRGMGVNRDPGANFCYRVPWQVCFVFCFFFYLYWHFYHHKYFFLFLIIYNNRVYRGPKSFPDFLSMSFK